METKALILSQKPITRPQSRPKTAPTRRAMKFVTKRTDSAISLEAKQASDKNVTALSHQEPILNTFNQTQDTGQALIHVTDKVRNRKRH
jgi:hypothetical protein